MITDRVLDRLVKEADPAWHRKHTATEDEASILCNAAHARICAMAFDLALELQAARRKLRVEAANGKR